MRYLIVQPVGNFSRITILPEGATAIEPYEVWALRTGEQITFVSNRLAGLLRNSHITGTYEKGSTYLYSYDDLIAIIRMGLGPTDRERFEVARGSAKPRVSNHDKWIVAGEIAGQTSVFLVKIMLMAFKCLAVLLLVPIVLGILNKRNR